MTRAAFTEVTVEGLDGVWVIVRPHWAADRTLTAYSVRPVGTMDPTQLVEPSHVHSKVETFDDELDAHVAESMQDPEYAAAVVHDLGPRYEQLTIPGAPSRPRRAGTTPRAHCTRCGRFASHAHRETDTGSCVVHGACHLTWD
jgi:hypothetical protein